MFKWILRLALLLVIGVLVYNYFLGDSQEKEQSKAIFQQVKSLGKSFSTLLVSEKEKFDAGKYNTALDKVETFIQGLRDNEASLDKSRLDQLEKLEKKHEQLRIEIKETEKLPAEEAEARKAQLRKELDALLKDADTLLEGLE